MSLKGLCLRLGLATDRRPDYVDWATKQGWLSLTPCSGPFAYAPNYNINPALFAEFKDHFFELRMNDSDEIGWVGTAIGDGLTTGPVVQDNMGNGIVKMTTDDDIGAGYNLQWHATAFQVPTSGRLWFSSRIRATDARSNIRIGLFSGSTNVFLGTPYSISFRVAHTSGDLTLVCRNAGGEETATVAGAFVGSTWHRLDASLSADGEVEFFLDEVEVGSLSTRTPVGDLLAPTVAIAAGVAAPATAYLDYVNLIVES